MKMEEVKRKVTEMGLKLTPGMNKSEMIRAIQVAEGNMPCFRGCAESCTQVSCCWRDDCMPEK
jgi:hypothetical protein